MLHQIRYTQLIIVSLYTLEIYEQHKRSVYLRIFLTLFFKVHPFLQWTETRW